MFSCGSQETIDANRQDPTHPPTDPPTPSEFKGEKDLPARGKNSETIFGSKLNLLLHNLLKFRNLKIRLDFWPEICSLLAGAACVRREGQFRWSSAAVGLS